MTSAPRAGSRPLGATISAAGKVTRCPMKGVAAIAYMVALHHADGSTSSSMTSAPLTGHRVSTEAHVIAVTEALRQVPAGLPVRVYTASETVPAILMDTAWTPSNNASMGLLEAVAELWEVVPAFPRITAEFLRDSSDPRIASVQSAANAEADGWLRERLSALGPVLPMTAAA